jgi:hypothetical protein
MQSQLVPPGARDSSRRDASALATRSAKSAAGSGWWLGRLGLRRRRRGDREHEGDGGGGSEFGQDLPAGRFRHGPLSGEEPCPAESREPVLDGGGRDGNARLRAHRHVTIARSDS